MMQMSVLKFELPQSYVR